MPTGRFATYPSLAGKALVITGGATGIGRAMVFRFVEQGALVAVIDRDREAGESLMSNIGEPHLFFHCDVTQTHALQTVIREAAEEFGRLDVLIANAANDARHLPAEVTPTLWDECLSVNLGHQFFASQAAEPHMRATGGGTIICLGSIAWLNNTTGMVAYTTAKAGVQGLVRTLARLWGPAGIRVNALVPGWTMTDRQKNLWVNEAAEREIDNAQCLKGWVMPDDIARMALFLASDDAAMITQQSFVVDGGWI